MTLLGVEFRTEAVEFLCILGLFVAFTGEALASVRRGLEVGIEEGEDEEKEEKEEERGEEEKSRAGGKAQKRPTYFRSS